MQQFSNFIAIYNMNVTKAEGHQAKKKFMNKKTINNFYMFLLLSVTLLFKLFLKSKRKIDLLL